MSADLPSLPPAADLPVGAHQAHHCGNCEAILTGPYCAQCGQHAHASARNLHAVLHDAWHDLTHVDGRLWHTLWLLLTRPGRLTTEYFHERRASYLPPVRLYLVLSVAFFALNVANLHTRTRHHAAAAGAAAATAPAPSLAAPPATPPAAAPAKAAPADDDDDDAPAPGEVADAKAGPASDVIGCEHVAIGTNAWLTDLARSTCENATQDGGDAFRAQFLNSLLHNIPRMMFVFLPMMAAVMLLLYWRPRRYYVEHLVLLLHNHSALFLGFLLLDGLGFLGRHVHALRALTAIGGFAIAGYAAWYPYKAMRRYYGQGRLLTLAKYAAIATAYLVCLILTLAGAALVSALEG